MIDTETRRLTLDLTTKEERGDDLLEAWAEIDRLRAALAAAREAPIVETHLDNLDAWARAHRLLEAVAPTDRPHEMVVNGLSVNGREVDGGVMTLWAPGLLAVAVVVRDDANRSVLTFTRHAAHPATPAVDWQARALAAEAELAKARAAMPSRAHVDVMREALRTEARLPDPDTRERFDASRDEPWAGAFAALDRIDAYRAAKPQPQSHAGEVCPECVGHGWDWQYDPVIGRTDTRTDCAACNGTGRADGGEVSRG